MIFAIHGRNIFGLHLGLAVKQSGHKVVTGMDATVPCDIALLGSIREPELIEAYKAAGVPVFIYEQGYVKRTNGPSEHQIGHWQLSKDWLNGLPDFECKADRFDSLDTPIGQKGGDAKGYVLVLGQKPGDSALNGTDHVQWLRDRFDEYDNVVYRPHPKRGYEFDASEVTQQEGTLQEAFAGAKLVVCYNSTAGFAALLAGVPVVCDPCAPYAELSGTRLPAMKKRRAFFNRVAYGQWRVDQTKAAVEFLTKEWLPRC